MLRKEGRHGANGRGAVVEGNLMAGQGVMGAHARLSFANHLARGHIQQRELEKRLVLEVAVDRKRVADGNGG
ncbi:hypothetical protein SADUNF_Sadunf17G0051300 [Salix dunnii]|uniref:Uncharacterized protein n=1 Tax=Salix dunnii TaxID=1413687 RepID=A0A835J510_9ROSI|nr:hypothetical protein SADUNF_Sadunf17G0051300 [Salix dunnii]